MVRHADRALVALLELLEDLEVPQVAQEGRLLASLRPRRVGRLPEGLPLLLEGVLGDGGDALRAWLWHVDPPLLPVRGRHHRADPKVRPGPPLAAVQVHLHLPGLRPRVVELRARVPEPQPVVELRVRHLSPSPPPGRLHEGPRVPHHLGVDELEALVLVRAVHVELLDLLVPGLLLPGGPPSPALLVGGVRVHLLRAPRRGLGGKVPLL